jgi:aminocarboxymuconate-semialdehyde decarboxylase
VIDVHSHVYPASYLQLLSERTEIPRVVRDRNGARIVTFPEEADAPQPGGRPITREFWDLESKLSFMDEHGIDRALVTLGNPWLDPFVGPEGPAIARALNEELSGFQEQTNGRILGTGVLPSDAVGSAVAIAEEIAETPTLYGIGGGPAICGFRFDDPELNPLWQVLEGSGLPYLLHPKGEAASKGLAGYGAALPVAVGFPMETTISLARLAMAGVLDRYPSLRIVAAHGGGAIPYLAGRLDMVWSGDEALRQRLPSPPASGLTRLYLDVVVYTARAARAAADLVGPDRLMFGTDHPWYSSVGDRLETAFDGEDLEQIREGTAVELFGLPVAREGPSVDRRRT